MGRGVRQKGVKQPLVSIVLCTFNRARLIRRAIHSVRRQRYENWELIIVDDGSTDRTSEILAPFPLIDDRIILQRQSNMGLAGARNTGLRAARGSYICFLDSDDEYRPTHISARVAKMSRARSVDMLYGGLTVTGPLHKRYVADLERPGERIHVRNCFVGGTFFMRRSIIERGYRFRQIQFGEDLDLIRRVQKRFAVKKVEGMRTYVYHCEAYGRMSDAFTDHALRAGN